MIGKLFGAHTEHKGMERLVYLLKRRPVALSVVVLVVLLLVGTAIEGPEFIYEPLPLPQWIANIWLTCNLVFCLITCVTVYRNVLKYEEKFTWQETFIIRGICWMLLGASVGYAVHLLTRVAFVTVGTPGFTLGILTVLYGSLRDPVRFSEENTDGDPR